jgi:hypothetical protein
LANFFEETAAAMFTLKTDTLGSSETDELSHASQQIVCGICTSDRTSDVILTAFCHLMMKTGLGYHRELG